ncbi:MAG: glycosyltransferase family 4 protein [Candidatus Micrarchaeia archaeon]|jgi:glycosyltransferase involved in cell wall biosynthesis
MVVRVAMLGWEFPPFVSGGLGTHCYELTRALSKRGVEIDFFMPKTTFKISEPWLSIYPADWSFFQEYDFQNISLTPVDYSGYCGAGSTSSCNGTLQDAVFSEKAISEYANQQVQSKSYGLGFFEAVKLYNFLSVLMVQKLHSQKPYDLVHCHDWISARAGMQIQRRTGLALVTTIHSTEYDRTASMWPFEQILNVEKDAVQQSDQVITVSKRSAQLLTDRFGADLHRLNVVYNAIDASKFQTRKETYFESQKPVKVVLYHGRLSVQKGVEFFLKAAQKVFSVDRNVRFFISGKGDLLPKLVEMAFDLGISDRVTFLGYVSDEEMKKIFCTSDVLVLPSVSEPFGIVALEAMASGTPALVSKTSGVSERVKNCLTVDFWDTDEMAAKVLAMLNYPSLSEEMRQNSIEEAASITWDEVARQTVDVYELAIRTRYCSRPAAIVI